MDNYIRGWNSRINKMLYKTIFDRDWYYTECNTETGCNTARTLMPEDKSYIRIMFSLGIKDKYGQRIYQEDYLKDRDGTVYKVFYSGFEMKYEISFGRTNGECVPFSHFWLDNLWDKVDLEVIGNRFENPDIKTGKQISNKEPANAND